MDRYIETNGETFWVKPYTDNDEKDVLSLWETVFGKEIQCEEWRWKYLENPFGNRILLAFDESGRIAGLYGGIPYIAKIEDEYHRIVQLMDIMTHPRVRKSGLFVKFAYQFCDFVEDYSPEPVFFYGFPGTYHLSIGIKYLKYEACTDKVIFLKYLMKKNDFSRRFDQDIQLRWLGIEDLTLFDPLWNRCKADYPLSVVRDSNFVKWRFMDHPRKSYSIMGAMDEFGALLGYLVFVSEADVIRMVDILLPDSESIVEDIFSGLVEKLLEAGVETIEAWLPESHFISNHLIHFGFENHPEPIGITSTVRRLTPNLSLEWISKNLFYTIADADLL